MSTTRTHKKAPYELAACAITKNPLYLTSGRWKIVDGVFCRPRVGEISAHEVIINGTATIATRGPVRVLAFGKSSVKAERHSRVYAFDDCQVTALPGSEVHARMKSRIDARPYSEVWIVADSPAIEAHGDAMVIVVRDAAPEMNMRGAATIVRFPQAQAQAA